MRKVKTGLTYGVFLLALFWSPQTQAKTWLIGLSALGGLYKQSQTDWNTLITNSESATVPHFNSKAQFYWGAQLDFIHLAFSGRFMIGLRYEKLKESVSSAASSSKNSAHLIYFTDTFYFFPIRNGFNMFVRVGAGYASTKGQYNITSTSSSLTFNGRSHVLVS